MTDSQIGRLKKDAVALVIPHFASNAELAKGPKIFVRGEGCYVYDIHGRKYFDSFATLLTTVCGHCRSEVTRAVTEQMNRLEFFPNYVDSYTVPLVRLARKLAEIAPGDLSVSFFVNSGSEANETALKMARQYHIELGQRQRYKFIARRDSYHATTLGAAAVTGLKWFREYFEPLMPGALFVSAARDRDRPKGVSSKDYARRLLKEIENLIAQEGADSIAGFIMDPLPPKGYLRGVRELCDKHGILLIFDEVQTGFGKTGKWFFCEHEHVTPDIMTLGKGLTGGFIPLGVTMTTPKVARVFQQGPGHELRSGSTYGGHTVACAATLANIEIIEREKLVENARRMGQYLRRRLGAMQKRHPVIARLSGIGLLQAIVLRADAKVGTWIRDWCWNNGFILRNNGNILVMAPSLIITRRQVDEVLELLDRALTHAERKFHLR